MQIESKKGGMMDENLIGLILSVAVVFVLIVLLFNLFSPSFDKGDKTAESYFESLEGAIGDADAGGKGDFFMQDYGDDELDFYLVYFGGTVSFGDDGKNFTRSKQGEKVICVCYLGEGNAVCNYCEDSKFPVEYFSIKEADEGSPQKVTVKISPWIVRENERINIISTEGHYEFTKI